MLHHRTGPGKTPMTHRKPLLVLAGPTASGKTVAGIEMALEIGGEIVSADSVQVYRFLDIGSAKPTPEERRRVPHHCIDVANPDEPFSAGRYREIASAAIDGVLERGRIPIVVGGTGLYIRALTHGLFDGPMADPELRMRMEAMENESPGILHRHLSQVDPETAARLHPNDRVRLIRALEVWHLTGIPISRHHQLHAETPPAYETFMWIIDPPVQQLRERIRSRVKRMLEDGFVEEVRELRERYGTGVRSLDSVGYRQVGAFLDGQIAAHELEEAIARAHEKYVKQQRTWFRDFPNRIPFAGMWPRDRIREWAASVAAKSIE